MGIQLECALPPEKVAELRKSAKTPTTGQLRTLCHFGNKLLGHSEARTRVLGNAPYNSSHTLIDVQFMLNKVILKAESGEPIGVNELRDYPHLLSHFKHLLAKLTGRTREARLMRIMTFGSDALSGHFVSKQLSRLHCTIFSGKKGEYVAFDHSRRGTLVTIPEKGISYPITNNIATVDIGTMLMFGEPAWNFSAKRGGFCAQFCEDGPKIMMYGNIMKDPIVEMANSIIGKIRRENAQRRQISSRLGSAKRYIYGGERRGPQHEAEDCIGNNEMDEDAKPAKIFLQERIEKPARPFLFGEEDPGSKTQEPRP